MKILYFYQYFSTPKGSWGTRVYEFAKNWVEAGHEVEVVSAIYTKSDIRATQLVELQDHDGIAVRVLNVIIDNRRSFFKRVMAFIIYSLLSTYYALTVTCDVVVASSGPITAWIPGVFASIVRRKPLVLEVRDLWPEGAIELGIIRNPLIKKCARWFEAFCYRRSCLIVSLSPGMRDTIKDRFPTTNVISVPNSANIKLFSTQDPMVVLPDFFSRKKVAIYTGNIGTVNNSHLLLEAAKLLQERGRSDILILLIGQGQQKAELEEASAEVDTFTIHNLIPKDQLVSWIQASLVSLVPLVPSPIIDTSSPNKLFESLAAGVPVIQTTNGWIKELIADSHCGINVSACDAGELCEALITLADDPQRAAQMGQCAQKLARARFDKDILADEMITAIERAVI